MGQERLEGLLFLSCEMDININYEETKITQLGRTSDA